MKLCRWLCYGYLIAAFITAVYLGERYSYYMTGLAGYTPTHSRYANEDLEYYENQSFKWKLCKGGFSAVRALIGSNTTIGVINPAVKFFCFLGTGNKQLCEGMFDSYSLPVFENLMLRVMDVDYQCFYLSLWDDWYYEIEKIEDYKDRLSSPKPDNSYPKQKPEKLIRMLQISDAHVDRAYLEGTNTEWETPSWWRYDSGKGQGNDTAGYWGFVGRCDIPMRTAEVGLDHIMDQDIDFIIWTGDNIDHYIWYQTYENQFFNQRYLKKYLLENLKYKGPIYPCLGNHEGMPTDMFSNHLHKWIFESFAEIWKEWLTPEAHFNMSNYGYYHMKHLDTNLRIISTFSLVYDIQNWYLVGNHTDPLNHLTFMEQILDYWETHNEVAYIIGHIPPGDVFTLSNWSTRFRALVNRYTNIIRGQFYGHTHYDEFKNIKSYRDDVLSAGTVWAVGSFTAYPRKQPGLRIWEVDSQTWHLWDYEQHRMYVNNTNIEANKVRQNPNYTEEELRKTGKWQIAYKFRDYFSISMQFEEIAKYIQRIKDEREVSNKIITMMHWEGPDSIKRIDEMFWTYWRYANSVFDDHWACNGNTGNALDYVFQGLQLFHGGSGEWWHKEPTEKYLEGR